jgi:3-oxoacyl-(acyl-carrier-protein) synthase
MAKHVHGVTAYTATGNTLSVASGRISYTFGLRGPALTVDTACSSSLVSLHTAFNAITLGQCTQAVNAGANLMLSVDTPAAFAKSGMLAADGRCKTLDAAADGYVRAEAAGAYFLQASNTQTLSEVVYAVLRATSINQDGRSSSLTAPNGPAQQDVIRAALSAAEIHLAELTGVEMHGTGTGLGDPIEIGALAAVVEGRKTTNSIALPLVLMAGKSLIGHSEPAAGVMGIAHAQLAVNGNAALPLLHLHSVNAYIAPVLKQSAGNWSLQRNLGALPVGGSSAVTTVGVSSFAFQGTNAHALVSSSVNNAMDAPECSTWQRSRYWVHPSMHSMVSMVNAKSGGLSSFEAHFGTTRLAEFTSAVVSNNSAVFCMGIALQLPATAVNQLSLSSSTTPMLANVALTTTRFAPAMILACLIDGKSGEFELHSSEFTTQSRCGTGRVGWVAAEKAVTSVSAAVTGGKRSVVLSNLVASTITATSKTACITTNAKTNEAIASAAAFESAFAIESNGLLISAAAGVVVSNFVEQSQASTLTLSSTLTGISLFGNETGVLAIVDGISTSKGAALPAATAAAVEISEEQEGVVYETVWVASKPETALSAYPTPSGNVLIRKNKSGSDAGYPLAALKAGVTDSGVAAVAATVQPAWLPASMPSAQSNFSINGAAVRGMLKALAQELPAMQTEVLSSDAATAPWQLNFSSSSSTIISSNSSDAHGIASAARALFEPRLLPTRGARSISSQSVIIKEACRFEGLQLVTGGSGVLAGHTALWLLKSGASGVQLASRSGVLPSVKALTRSDEYSNAMVTAVKADASFDGDLREVLLVGGGDVRGVFHAGGVLVDATLANQTLSGLRQVTFRVYILNLF